MALEDVDAREAALLEEGSSEDLPGCVHGDAEQEALCPEEAEQLPPAEALEEPLCVHEEEGDDGKAPPLVLRSARSSTSLVSRERRRVCIVAATALAVVALVSCMAAAYQPASGRSSPAASAKRTRGAAAVGRGLVSEQMEPWPSAPGAAQEEPWPTSCVYGETPMCPARALFKNPEVHQVAAGNILRVDGERLLNERDHDKVRAAVEKGFLAMDAEIEQHAPSVAEELDAVPLTEPQKDAVLRSMRLMSDRRVQSVGRDVAEAIRESTSTDSATLRRAIEAKLRPRLEEIAQLRRELVPAELRDMWATGHLWNMTLEPSNIRVMRPSAPCSGPSAAGLVLPSQDQKSYSIVGGVLEEGRALVDIIQSCARLFGKDLALPSAATVIPGSYDFSSDSFTCEGEVGGVSDRKASFMKAFYCPLKFGSQGVDALRAEPSMACRVAA